MYSILKNISRINIISSEKNYIVVDSNINICYIIYSKPLHKELIKSGTFLKYIKKYT